MSPKGVKAGKRQHCMTWDPCFKSLCGKLTDLNHESSMLVLVLPY